MSPGTWPHMWATTASISGWSLSRERLEFFALPNLSARASNHSLFILRTRWLSAFWRLHSCLHAGGTVVRGFCDSLLASPTVLVVALQRAPLSVVGRLLFV